MRNLKNLFGIIIFLLSYDNSFSQSNVWQWAKSASGTSWEYCAAITNDNNGNVFIGGSFESSILNFDNFQLIKNPANVYGEDFFVAKYNTAGYVVWAKNYGGVGSNTVNSITTDTYGNTFVTGVFDGDTLIIGPDTLYRDQEAVSIFISKFDQSGNPVWTKRIYGDTEQISKSLTTDTDGNVLITGYFISTELHLDTITLVQNLCGGAYQTFLAKYSNDGNILWAKKSDDIGIGISRTVQTDSENNIYISGDYSDSNITFDTIELINHDFTGIGSADVFLTKYSPAGDVEWAKSINGGDDDFGKSMVIDTKGNIYQTGISYSPTLTLGNLIITKSPGSNSYLCKYDKNGNALWAKQFGSSDGGMIPYNLAIDSHTDEFFMTGYCIGSPGTFLNFGNFSLPFSDTTKVFLTEFDSTGTGYWAQIIGKKSQYGEASISVDPFSNLYIAGNFDSSTITFGSDTLINVNPGTIDIYTSKLSLLTGLKNEYDKNGLIIFPNPSNKFVTFSSKANMSIDIFNMSGVKVKSFKLNGDVSLNINDLPSGLFLVRAVSDKGISTDKLIKQ